MKITLCIDKQDRNNPSSELRQYCIDIGCSLRSIDSSFDELKISTDDDNNLIGKIIRRCYIDKYGVLKKLDVEETQDLEIPEIILFEGVNYVYIKEFTNLNMKIEYLTNAEMNKYFASKVEMKTTIKQTYDSIMLAVSEKADSKEVSAMIKLLSDEIALKVAKGDVVNEFNISDELISIIGNRLKIDTDNFKLTEDGTMTAKGANFVNGNINTNKDLIVGDNIYIGTNQSTEYAYRKMLIFSDKTNVSRAVIGSSEALSVDSEFINLKGKLSVSDTVNAVNFNTLEANSDSFVLRNCNGTEIYGGNGFISMSHQPSYDSDKRLKKKIKKVDVSWIKNLKVKEYEYKNTPNKKQIGLIAQDYLKEEYAKYFLQKKQNGFYSINYGNITNALIQYCQQLNNKIIKLEQQIKEMR